MLRRGRGSSFATPKGEGPRPSTPPVSSGKATGAIVCGIFAILLAWAPLFGIVLGVVAIVLASKAVKEAGKTGKATGGKVCGIVGIVLSVFAFVLYLALGAGLMASIASNPNGIATTYTSSPIETPSSAFADSERQMEAVVAVQYDKLKNKDADTIQSIAAKLDSEFAGSVGYSLTDLGVEPQSFAEWMLADFDYKFDGAYSNNDGTGTVYADITMRDPYAFAAAFLEDAQAAVDAGEFAALDEAASKARLGEIYRACMDKSTSMTTGYSSVQVVGSDDAWKVDENSWNTELEYLFDLA